MKRHVRGPVSFFLVFTILLLLCLLLAPSVLSLWQTKPPKGLLSEDEIVAVNGFAAFADDGVSDTHTATFAWGDGTSSAASVAEGGGTGGATCAPAGPGARREPASPSG